MIASTNSIFFLLYFFLQLRKFFSVTGGEEAFVAYAERVCAELAAKADGPRMDRLDGTVFGIFGHAVFLNAVVYAIAKVVGVADMDALLDADLGEAEGLLLDLSAKTITHLK
jgi:hypothetical protein